jgi:hypothetical protein
LLSPLPSCLLLLCLFFQLSLLCSSSLAGSLPLCFLLEASLFPFPSFLSFFLSHISLELATQSANGDTYSHRNRLSYTLVATLHACLLLPTYSSIRSPAWNNYSSSYLEALSAPGNDHHYHNRYITICKVEGKYLPIAVCLS